MRKIILYIADSLDGFIARRNDDVSWLFTDADYGYKDFYSSIDTVLMGRKTYSKILEMDSKYHYKDKIRFVFTRDKSLKDNDHVKFIQDDIDGFVNDLRKNDGKDIWLVGGGEIIKYFIDNKLIDQIILSIHPKILGDGLPLFIPPLKETDLKLVNCIKFDSGLVQLDYEVLK